VTSAKAQDPELLLVDAMVECYADPLKFVMFAFEWGHGALDGFTGPDKWQTELLNEIGDEVKARCFNGVDPVAPIREAVASGHGIGKSTITAWLILWIMSTRPHCKGVVTANTSSQLETKTWAELAKWHKRCVTGHWFKLTTGKMSMRICHVQHPESWRCDALTCREENSEAFAGLHAANSTPYYIFDESSAISDVIWDVAEGGMTDGEPMWFAFGNPTRNTGRFRECFGKFRHRWKCRQIDSRTAKMTNKTQLAEWVKDYGEDSDFVRTRVRGVFPRAGSTQFISSEIVELAASDEREATHGLYDPRIMGVDVARFGDDSSVIRIRIGRDARSIKPIKIRGADTMQLAARVVEEAQKHQVDAIFVDGGGVGGGVVDRLRYLRQPVTEVQFGGAADRSQQTQEGSVVYANKRAEMYGYMRDWLATGCIDDDPELVTDLSATEYGFVLRDGRDAIQLESKKDMKKRGLASPDNADALALTFAYPVASSNHLQEMHNRYSPSHSYDYDPSSWS
jgi:hypothetical protein